MQKDSMYVVFVFYTNEVHYVYIYSMNSLQLFIINNPLLFGLSLGGAIIVFVAVLLTVILSIVFKNMDRVEDEYISKGDSSIIESVIYSSKANFFGITSLGTAQIRGNGRLILTQSELYFTQALTKKIVRIPVKNITSIDTTQTSHLGKTKMQPLLTVHFRRKDGSEDSVAWLVANPTEWKQQIEAVQ